MRLLIVGCGYVGSAVADLVQQEMEVYALTRSRERAAELETQGIRPIIGHWLDSQQMPKLPHVDYLLVSVPHREDQQLGTETHCRGMANLLEKLPAGWKKLVYLSTTGVFGDCAGETVNEDSPVSPTRIGPQIAVAAEHWLTEHLPFETVNAWRFTILRLAGIYGAGRIPLAERIRSGEPLAVPRQGYLNLVHVEDIARMLGVVMQRQLKKSCYVFSDGNPVPREEFYRYLAGLCQVPEPRFVEPEPDDPRQRRATSKRIDPQGLVQECGFQYRYPDYRSGLQASL